MKLNTRLHLPEYLHPNFDDNHRRLHFRLTFIFSLAIIAIIIIYTGLLLGSHSAGKKRFQDNLNSQLPPPPMMLSNTRAVINTNFQEYEKRTQTDLYFFDFLIWTCGSIIGYFLTGYLLLPAQKKAREQIEFIGNASHELKTPITTIKTELKLLEKNDKVSAAVKNSLTVINDEANNLQNLVNNLLNFNSSQDQTHLSSFNFAPLLQNKARQYQKIGQNKNLSFVIQAPADIFIISDSQKLSQILDLLLDNAKKYSSPASTISLNWQESKDSYQLSITNQGLGISDKDAKKIFQRFYRVTDITIQKEIGSGLGLAIARQLAQSIQAKLELIDGSSAHTTFTLILPKKPS